MQHALHLPAAIVRWTMEEQGARRRALQHVIQLYRLYGLKGLIIFAVYIATYSLALRSKPDVRRRDCITAVLSYFLYIPFFEC